jgi:hypothetical protein
LADTDYDDTAGGRLEGTWLAENSVANSSDKRLKTRITPLFQGMLSKYRKQSASMSPQGTEQTAHDPDMVLEVERNATMVKQDDREIMKVVRQLRPVSFEMKQSAESKTSTKSARTHFGFIAQEMETLLPDLVDTSKKSGMKAIRYSDLVAVITIGLQGVDRRVDDVDNFVDELIEREQAEYERLEAEADEMETVLDRILVNIFGKS